MAKFPVCHVEDIPIGERGVYRVGDTRVIVFHLEDGFFATQHNCTHVFAPLAKGKLIDGAQVQCPFHRACFDIRTGAVVQWANFPPGVQVLNAVRGEKALRTFPVTVENGEVYVEVD
ncbi:Rieske (2Fe-2S) protein [Haliea sp. E17]|uniref:Rieske (2Fe-2S) protein n=1 Tax=Haliea sp. E17 TaxID=3401576 RepID=UPI003AAD546B